MKWGALKGEFAKTKDPFGWYFAGRLSATAALTFTALVSNCNKNQSLHFFCVGIGGVEG
jgi:hypothetical protein